MGDTISSLVFRPPKPTPIHPSDYFYLDVDVHSPLCTNRAHRRNGHTTTYGTNDGRDDDDQSTSRTDGGCFVGRCIETGESDLASLDTSFIGNKDKGCYNHDFPMACSSPLHYMTTNDINNTHGGGEAIADIVPNVRNGQVYKIPAFFIRRRNATQTILFSHGNAEDLGMMYARMKDLAMVLGVNILAYDYTGYGLSIPGPAHKSNSSNNGNTNSSSSNNSSEGPSENMIYRNIEAAYRYLTRVRKIPPHKIILYGRSIGSGPACYLAAKTSINGNPVGGLILHSPFLSVYKVVADLNGLDMGIVGDLFHNEKRARNVRCPTLIIHGREDEVVPFWHAPRLLAAIPPEFRAAPYYVDNMGHNHIESRCRDKYVKVVLNFLAMGVVSAAASNPATSPSTTDATIAQVMSYYRGPTPVPVNERASISETAENPTFYVNKTWLRHAKVLLRDVLSDVGCYVNNTDWDDCKTRTTTGTTSTRSKNSSSGTSRASSSSNRNVSGGGGGVTTISTRNDKSDARDDNDEFAPWRSGENHHPKGWQQQQQKQPQLSPESVLMTRSNNDSNVSNNMMRPSKGGAGSIMTQFTKHVPSSSPTRRVTMPFQKRY